MNFVSPENIAILQSSFLSALILIGISLSMRFFLSMIGQTWVKTFSHTATILILPLITFVITKVISGNIALSLGMVGALSIVRFRNPVKSPFELAVYFGCVTMGIAASVSLMRLLYFAVIMLIAATILVLTDYFSRLSLKKSIFQTSFSEGNQLATLQVYANESIRSLENSDFLISFLSDQNGYKYVLASSELKSLKKISDDLDGNALVTSRQYNS